MSKRQSRLDDKYKGLTDEPIVRELLKRFLHKRRAVRELSRMFRREFLIEAMEQTE